MKTKILSLVAALVVGVTFAETQYLYWMVDLDNQPDYAFSYATVSAGGTVLLNNTNSGQPAGEAVGNVNLKTGGIGTKTASYYAYDVSSYLDSTFLFELFDADENRIGYKSVAASSLSDFIGGSMAQIESPYVVSQVVPEPTSGLLMLLGLAGLALRRRRVA